MVFDIENIDQLKSLNGKAEYLAKYYKLQIDIDLDGLKNFKPIGNSNFLFKGRFDGKGKVIRNLTINRPAKEDIRLFGKIAGSTTVLKNIGLEDVKTSSSERWMLGKRVEAL